MQGQEAYILEKTVEFPNMVARIFRPILTEEEKTRRLKIIHKATAELLKGVREK